ncbi:MAG: hypothetical protein M1825_002404 [Sarcosagium campestre]|nr:MAG: hypothetical protein M1825_002404 [Sarcosagium campestre]
MSSLSAWAVPQLQRLLPLPESDLLQIIEYSSSQTPQDAADHLKNLLGDSARSLEFITSFNTRRNKTQSSDKSNSTGSNRQTQRQTTASSQPSSAKSHNARPSKPPPSASGPLISDLRSDYPSSSTTPPSASSKHSPRSSSPKTTKPTSVQISGGTPMHGASTALQDLEDAIRTLEISTNPSKSSQRKACPCYATRHPLLTAAPNCLRCGKVICVKEGLGPCTFCNAPLLSPHDLQAMIRSLRDERGREKVAVNNAAQGHRLPKQQRTDMARRLGGSGNSGPFQPAKHGVTNHDHDHGYNNDTDDGDDKDRSTQKLIEAQQHRDKLLGYQSTSAQRTRVHDEASDFDTPAAGTSMWASPQERALQLKRQQNVLRQQEWHARPAYEKRRAVASIDLVGGKVVRRMVDVKMPSFDDPDHEDDHHDVEGDSAADLSGNASTTGLASGPDNQGGSFSHNPLLGKLIRPVYPLPLSDETSTENGHQLRLGEAKGNKSKLWRRVQDENNDDNEEIILDGGIYGASTHL